MQTGIFYFVPTVFDIDNCKLKHIKKIRVYPCSSVAENIKSAENQFELIYAVFADGFFSPSFDASKVF